MHLYDQTGELVATLDSDYEIESVNKGTRNGRTLQEWLDEGVPSQRGEQQGDLMVEVPILVSPRDPLFGLALLDKFDEIGWHIENPLANRFRVVQEATAPAQSQWQAFTTKTGSTGAWNPQTGKKLYGAQAQAALQASQPAAEEEPEHSASQKQTPYVSPFTDKANKVLKNIAWKHHNKEGGLKPHEVEWFNNSWMKNQLDDATPDEQQQILQQAGIPEAEAESFTETFLSGAPAPDPVVEPAEGTSPPSTSSVLIGAAAHAGIAPGDFHHSTNQAINKGHHDLASYMQAKGLNPASPVAVAYAAKIVHTDKNPHAPMSPAHKAHFTKFKNKTGLDDEVPLVGGGEALDKVAATAVKQQQEAAQEFGGDDDPESHEPVKSFPVEPGKALYDAVQEQPKLFQAKTDLSLSINDLHNKMKSDGNEDLKAAMVAGHLAFANYVEGVHGQFATGQYDAPEQFMADSFAFQKQFNTHATSAMVDKYAAAIGLNPAELDSDSPFFLESPFFESGGDDDLAPPVPATPDKMESHEKFPDAPDASLFSKTQSPELFDEKGGLSWAIHTSHQAAKEMLPEGANTDAITDGHLAFAKWVEDNHGIGILKSYTSDQFLADALDFQEQHNPHVSGAEIETYKAALNDAGINIDEATPSPLFSGKGPAAPSENQKTGPSAAIDPSMFDTATSEQMTSKLFGEANTPDMHAMQGAVIGIMNDGGGSLSNTTKKHFIAGHKAFAKWLESEHGPGIWDQYEGADGAKAFIADSLLFNEQHNPNLTSSQVENYKDNIDAHWTLPPGVDHTDDTIKSHVKQQKATTGEPPDASVFTEPAVSMLFTHTPLELETLNGNIESLHDNAAEGMTVDEVETWEFNNWAYAKWMEYTHGADVWNDITASQFLAGAIAFGLEHNPKVDEKDAANYKMNLDIYNDIELPIDTGEPTKKQEESSQPTPPSKDSFKQPQKPTGESKPTPEKPAAKKKAKPTSAAPKGKPSTTGIQPHEFATTVDDIQGIKPAEKDKINNAQQASVEVHGALVTAVKGIAAESTGDKIREVDVQRVESAKDQFAKMIAAAKKEMTPEAVEQLHDHYKPWLDALEEAVAGGVDSPASWTKKGQLEAFSGAFEALAEGGHQFTTVKQLGGSTGAALVVDEVGNKFVRKSGNSQGHLKNEMLADLLYQQVGANVPKFYVDKASSGQLSKNAVFLKGKLLNELSGKDKEAALDKLRQNFAMDALLANWDVTGMNHDNVIVTADGEVHRIDNGGALAYRAQGNKKGQDWSGEAKELDSMRDPSNLAGKVFHTLSDKEVANQIKDLLEHRDSILSTVAHDEDMHDVLWQRMNYMDNWAAAKLGEQKGTPKKPLDVDVPPKVQKHIDKHFDLLAKQKAGTPMSAHQKAWMKIHAKKATALMQKYGYTEQTISDVFTSFDSDDFQATFNHSSGDHATWKMSPIKRAKSLGFKGQNESRSSFSLTTKERAENAEKLYANSTSEQRKSLKAYTGSYYATINAKLWECPQTLDCLSGEQKKHLHNMQAVIDAAGPMPKPTVVYRGINHGAEELLKQSKEAIGSYGTTMVLNGVTSTSVSPTFAAGWGGTLMLEISARHGAYVGKNDYKTLSSHAGEHEMILKHDTEYRPLRVLENVTVGGKKVTVIQMEEIGPAGNYEKLKPKTKKKSGKAA